MSLFGVWLRIPDVACSHYFLPGARRCLCGRHERPIPEVRAKHTGDGKAEDMPYPVCLELNEERWLTAYPRGRAT